MSFFQQLKSNKQPDQGEEGHYWISVSDLMTSILFIFIIILVYSIWTFKSEKDGLEAENAELQNKKQALNTIFHKLDKNALLRRELLIDLQQELYKKNIESFVDPENGYLRLHSDIYFKRESATLEPDGKTKISIFAELLVDRLENTKYSKAIDTIFIEGHTDSDPMEITLPMYGTYTNMELSTQRAINTYREMVASTDNKISELTNDRKKCMFSYSGYADTRPIDNNNTKETRAKNRRIEFYFTINNPEIDRSVLED